MRKICLLALFLITSIFTFSLEESNYIVYNVDFKKENVKFYWLNNDGIPFERIDNLLKLNPNKFKFIMNGGIYNDDFTPEGLYIENGKEFTPINLNDGAGNFYEKPNGIFYFYKNKPFIVTSEKFKSNSKINYALQSGPMLITNGELNPSFTDQSTSKFIRNGVCLTKNNSLIFIVSRNPVTLYEFSVYAKSTQNCYNFLYMDGNLSRAYKYNEMNAPQKKPFVTMIAVEIK